MGEHVKVDVHWPRGGSVDLLFTAPKGVVTEAELTEVNRRVADAVRGMLLEGTEYEERIPADLNPWKGVAVLALHSHVADSPCDRTCSVYS